MTSVPMLPSARQWPLWPIKGHQKGRQAAGFSLVEVMVGMVIGLLGIIVIFQVFALSEGYKRTATGGSDAQQNGIQALFYIERDARMAGYGIADPSILGCNVLAYDELRVPTDFNITLIPSQITQGADNNATTGVGRDSDVITITYGTGSLLVMPAALTQNMPSPAATFKVANRFGFKKGDLVIAAEPGKDCTLAEVTDLPGTSGQTDNVIHNNGTYTNPEGATVNARYNKPSGLGVSYTTNGKLFNIGSLPNNNAYSILSGNLMLTTTLPTVTSLRIADNIVNLQAVYGKDTVNTPPVRVDTWNATPPASWDRVLAVRIGLVARSANREKPNTAGVCAATTTAPSWSGGAFDLSADPDWQCYRYRVFETTVPLRNLIWKP